MQIKYFLIIFLAFFFVLLAVIFPRHYIYLLPAVVIFGLLLVPFKKIKENFHLIVWGVLFLSVFLGSARSPEGILEQRVDPVRMVRIVVMISLFLIAALNMFLANFKKVGTALKGPLGWFSLYAVIAMCSSLYSDQPLVSLWKGFEVLASVVVAIYVFQKLSTFGEINRFWLLSIIMITVLVISSYIGAVNFPGRAIRPLPRADFMMLRGIYPVVNPNSLSEMAAIVIAFFFVRFLYAPKFNQKLVYSFFILATLPCLIFSYGRTSIIALSAALFALFALNKNYHLVFLLIVALVIVVMFELGVPDYFIPYFDKGGSLETMSGRLYRWPVAWYLFENSPGLGYGFYVGSRIIFAEDIGQEYFSTTDNTYFDVLLSVGILGFVPFILMLFSFIKRLISKPDVINKDIIRLRLELVCVTVIILVRSLTGPSFNSLHWNLNVLLALILCTVSLKELKPPPGLQ